MEGGGLTWAGWSMVGIGGLLLYAGMTGQSLVAELAGVLSGKGLIKSASGSTSPPAAPAAPAGPAGAIPPVTQVPTAPHPPMIPVPPISPRVPA